MPVGTALDDDDYVISLLKKDAEANQKRYLANGLGSLMSKKPRSNAPKPNTRFLKNIIRETDSHNAALKAREEEESKARLKELRPGKRARNEEVDEGSSKRRRSGDRPGRWSSVLSRLGGGGDGRQGKSEGYVERQKERQSQRHERFHREVTREHRDIQSRRHRSRSSGSETRSPAHRKEKRRRPQFQSGSPPRARGASERGNEEAPGALSDSSDPLEDILGPKPASHSLARGRGALKSSDMDSRFTANYNPKTDVSLDLDEERDDWDMALEALRDRAKWRVQGADRLRAAGFTDEEVRKWEKGDEKDVDDVRWSKRGEGREWDRGKVVDEDGKVEVKAQWGRLKGTS